MCSLSLLSLAILLIKQKKNLNKTKYHKIIINKNLKIHSSMPMNHNRITRSNKFLNNKNKNLPSQQGYEEVCQAEIVARAA